MLCILAYGFPKVVQIAKWREYDFASVTGIHVDSHARLECWADEKLAGANIEIKVLLNSPRDLLVQLIQPR